VGHGQPDRAVALRRRERLPGGGQPPHGRQRGRTSGRRRTTARPGGA
jgi:hypothetical protein